MPERASALPRQTGCLILVVGPSGAGKDSLIKHARAALSGDRRFHFPKRIITRASDETEDHEPVTDAEFASKLEARSFLLHWRAHGLSYAIPADAAARLAQGDSVVVNVSRTIVSDACRAFENVRVVHVTADEEILRQRLEVRGREAAADRTGRLERGSRIELPSGCPVDEVENNGQLGEASARFIALLETYAANAPSE